MARAKAVLETVPPEPTARGPRRERRREPAPRRVVYERRYRQTVRSIDVWSVLKISLCFYMCALIVVLLAGVVLWLMPASRGGAAAAPAVLADVQPVIAQRCVMCHNAQVFQKNVQLHTPALVVQHAQQIYQQAVVARTMPLNNATGMTDDERALVRRWFEAGAPER